MGTESKGGTLLEALTGKRPSAAQSSTTPSPSDTSRVTARNLFIHPEAHPVVLDIAMLKKFGPEYLGWLPEARELLIRRDIHPDASSRNISKIEAMVTLHLVDSFWQQWEVFCWTTMALNGVFPDFVNLQSPSSGQCAVAVEIANHVRTDVPWVQEVRDFIGACFRHDELYLLPPVLTFATAPVLPEGIDRAEALRLAQQHKTLAPSHAEQSPTTMQAARFADMLHYCDVHNLRMEEQMKVLQ